VERDVDGFGV
jgi:hypothetical protein